jgi:hypothetical protein
MVVLRQKTGDDDADDTKCSVVFITFSSLPTQAVQNFDLQILLGRDTTYLYSFVYLDAINYIEYLNEHHFAVKRDAVVINGTLKTNSIS